MNDNPQTNENAHTDDGSTGDCWVSLNTGIGGMPFGRDEYLTKEQADQKHAALRLFEQAYTAQQREDFDEAAELYRQSIKSYPTAEAHTFLGWTYNFMGQTDDAIEECHKAIGVDPDFGNPYNDIGAYLIEKGEHYAAIRWLERALEAPRYLCYFYPHFNLGRIYEAQGRNFEALREYRTAVTLNPGYQLAFRAFRRLQGQMS